jgi:hypothetical protein
MLYAGQEPGAWLILGGPNAVVLRFPKSSLIKADSQSVSMYQQEVRGRRLGVCAAFRHPVEGMISLSIELTAWD